MKALIHYSEREGRRTWKRVGKSSIAALFCKINYFKLLNLSSEHSVLDWCSYEEKSAANYNLVCCF